MEISKETIALINTFKGPILNLLSDIKDEVKYYIDDGIINYVDSIREKFIRTKTFLYRVENVNFYDVYYPVTLKYKTTKNYRIEDIENLFESSNCISIIGNAGSGKTMLLKHVFLQSIMQTVRIPIVIELRNLNDHKGNFFDYLSNLLKGKKLAPNNSILERILTNGKFLFLLDGYDEIFSDHKNVLTTELIEFIDNYSQNYFLITSRPGANIESLPRFDNYYVNDLSQQQVEEFIKMQLTQCDDTKLAEKIITVTNKPENRDYSSYLSSPLLLSMFIMTFNSYPELPKSKSKFYWNVFDTLCTKHDSFTKHGGFQHERKTGLQNEDFENILKWFSYSSLFKGKYIFDDQYLTNLLKQIKSKLNLKCDVNNLIEDLTVAISIIVIDGLEYKFPHKSLQEYFSALLIKEQSDGDKKEIYSNKFADYSIHSFDGNSNFWNLCLEMDGIAFKKFFLLEHLEKFINDIIDFSSDELICQSYLGWLGLELSFDYNIKNDMFYLKRNGSFTGVIYSVLNFLELSLFQHYLTGRMGKYFNKHMVVECIKNHAVTCSNDKIYDEKEVTINFSNWDDNVYFFVCSTGFKDEILKTMNFIKKKICDLKKEIIDNEKNKADLLEL